MSGVVQFKREFFAFDFALQKGLEVRDFAKALVVDPKQHDLLRALAAVKVKGQQSRVAHNAG